MEPENLSDDFKLDIEAVSQELHVRSEILKKLITSFSGTLKGKIEELETALEATDIIKMRALLHEIKGTSGNLRLTNLYTAADMMHIEVKGEANDQKMKDYFTILKTLSEKLTAYVSQQFGT